MRLYKRGNIYWREFQVDKKHYQYSCKTRDKIVAQKVAAAINADTIRNKFNIQAKYKPENIFLSVWKEYLKNQATEKKRYDAP
jgi:hypothetical protein